MTNNPAYRKAYYWRDPERARAQTRKWALANPEKHRASTLDSHFRRNYGITLETYRADVIGQAGRCLVCGHVPDHNLVVDHDHRTGTYRGLLCQPCNRLLGDAHDDPRVLESAARYVGVRL